MSNARFFVLAFAFVVLALATAQATPTSAAAFTVNWGKTNRDRFRIKGKINPRGANVDLTDSRQGLTALGLARYWRRVSPKVIAQLPKAGLR